MSVILGPILLLIIQEREVRSNMCIANPRMVFCFSCTANLGEAVKAVSV
jgi:mannose/cellobiose epimerase-like protein (N-acyl-D-glucosamine 2-epimerase family)